MTYKSKITKENCKFHIYLKNLIKGTCKHLRLSLWIAIQIIYPFEDFQEFGQFLTMHLWCPFRENSLTLNIHLYFFSECDSIFAQNGRSLLSTLCNATICQMRNNCPINCYCIIPSPNVHSIFIFTFIFIYRKRCLPMDKISKHLPPIKRTFNALKMKMASLGKSLQHAHHHHYLRQSFYPFKNINSTVSTS